MNTTPYSRNALLAGAALAALCPLASRAQAPAAPQTAAPAAQSTTLRYKFAPGQVRRYKITMNMASTMLTGQSGAGVPMNTAVEMTMRQTVKSVRAADGAATLTTQVENMRMALNGQEMPMPAAAQAQMKKALTQTLLPTGKILAFEMPSMPGANTPGMDFTKGMMSSIAFPDGPVKVGDAWKGTAAMPGMAGTEMTIDSTLAAVTGSGDAARADVRQKIGGTLGMNLSKGMPMGMKMNGTVSGTGALIFNTAAGAIESQSNDTAIDMTMTFTPKPGQPAPQGMPGGMKMQMRQRTVMERLPDAPAAAVAPAR